MQVTWECRTPKEKSQGVRPQDFTLSNDASGGLDSLPRLIRETFRARGITESQSIQNWLSPSLKGLRDPTTLTDMDKAVARLLRALQENEKILIYADYDLDGTSGLVLTLKGLQALGFKNLVHFQPSRLTEGYGLKSNRIQQFAEQGVSLVITVDLGITAVAEVDFANSLGVDVIVTDHHLPQDKIPAAVAVVNPNRGNCTSGLGHLCGAGVAFYLILALKRALGINGFDPKSLLDCFAIATLTDLVPVIDENRILVKHGLIQLAKTERIGLRLILEKLELLGRPLTSQDLALRFAPKLNALSRMEKGIRPLDLYLVEDPDHARQLVDHVFQNNEERRSLQKSAEQEAFDYLVQNPPQNFAWVYSRNFHRGILGLVATKISQEFGVPAFVGAIEESGQIAGSARLPDASPANVVDIMATTGDSLLQFGGHAMAAGFELMEAKAEAFGAALRNYFEQNPWRPNLRKYIYDVEAELAEINPTLMKWYESLEPFGNRFAAPMFRLNRTSIREAKTLTGGHFRLTLADVNGITRTALWFFPPKAHPVLQTQLSKSDLYDFLVEPQWNYFRGERSLQLVIADVRQSGSATIN